MNSESILQTAESTDPFRMGANNFRQRVTARELDEQKASGKKLTMWKSNPAEQISFNPREERLLAESDAGSLTSSTTHSTAS
jgi:hypothetical protein